MIVIDDDNDNDNDIVVFIIWTLITYVAIYLF